jgi:predicted HD phosphohydrolase
MENFINTLIIIEKHFKPSKSAYTCAFMAMELAPYYTKLAWLDANEPSLVAATILHDYQGLSSDIDDFLPRLA